MAIDGQVPVAVSSFITRWATASPSERANSQLFLAELCDVLGVERPDPRLESGYSFEHVVVERHVDGTTSSGRIDLYKRGCFVLESKQFQAKKEEESQLELVGQVAGVIERKKFSQPVRLSQLGNSAKIKRVADVFDRAKRSSVMSAIRSKGNKETEVRLLEIFKRHGVVGWRRNYTLFGKPDFCFPRERLAIFVDGCFWHGCRKHGRNPNSNQAYWTAKLLRNRRRDVEVGRMLKRNGWTVVRLWEHDLKHADKVIPLIERRTGKKLSMRKNKNGTKEQ